MSGAGGGETVAVLLEFVHAYNWGEDAELFSSLEAEAVMNSHGSDGDGIGPSEVTQPPASQW